MQNKKKILSCSQFDNLTESNVKKSQFFKVSLPLTAQFFIVI